MVTKCLRQIRFLCLCLAVVYTLPATVASAQSAYPAEEQAVRDVVARFYEGWNEHDVDKMVSIYAEDIDHINAFGELHKGKPAIREALKRFHAGPGKNSRKTITIEKIRFIKPDVAVVQVRQQSAVGNIGTFVMSKESGEWLVVSFTNVEYKLTPTKRVTAAGKRSGSGQ